MNTRFHQFQARFLMAGIIVLVASVIGAFFDRRQFFVSYLFSYLFWIGLAAGCIIVAMIHYLTGGAWGHPVRRIMEAGYSTLPLMALLYIPILFGLGDLYPWANASPLPEMLKKKQAYLNEPFFIARVVFILAIWAGFAWRLRRWSLAQDTMEETHPTKRLAALSGPGLVIVPLTATFAYIDWIMSMEVEWYSTIFAVIVLSGQVLAAFAFAVILLKLFEGTEPISRITSRKHFHQLGNLLLTFVMFWTYVSFSQLLIIYAGNKPEEIAWYLHRITGGWRDLIIIIALFHFLLPFLLLLFRTFKRRSAPLAALSVGLLLMQLLYAYWMVGPSISPHGVNLSWLNFAVPLGLGAIWMAAFLSSLSRAPLVPLNDPRIREELAHAGN